MTYRITITGDPVTDAETIIDALDDLDGSNLGICYHCLKKVLSGDCVNLHGSEGSAK